MEKAIEVIKKWKLNKRVLAERMGLTVEIFNNKLNIKHASIFTQDEKMALRNILIEMMTDLDKATDIDFNEALKTLLDVPV